jgi:hypothetical protein
MNLLSSSRRPELFISLSGPLLAGTVVVVGALTPGYSHARDTVSLLAASGHAISVAACTGMALYGALVIAGAHALDGRLEAGAPRVRALVCLYGASAIVAGLAPKYPSEPHALLSRLHVAATIAGGAALLGAMSIAAIRAPSSRDRCVSRTALVLVAIGVLVFRWTWDSPIYGLVERTLLLIAICWIANMAMTRRGHRHDRTLGSLSGDFHGP